MCKVSVVVPVYNVENYLKRCVDSLINQTIRPYEIILVDDGSSDRSGALCDDYCEPYIKVLHKANEGLGMTRNAGIKYASGDYVMFIDSDDCYDPDMIEQLLNAKKRNSVNTVISGLRRVNKDGETIRIENKYENEVFFGSEVKKELLPRIIGRAPNKKDSLGVSVCGTLYSLKIIREYNIQFVSERRYLSEDLLFNIDYLGRIDSVATISYYGYQYYVNDNTLSTKYREERASKYCDLYYLEEEKLMRLNVYSECKERLSCQFFNRIRICIKQENILLSGFSKEKALRNIKDICNRELFQSLIKGYPIRKLGIKRFAFLWLVKNKQARVLLKISKYL